MVADSLGKLPRPTRVLDQTYTVEPAQDGERFVDAAPRRPGAEPDRRVSRRVGRASGCRGAAGAAGDHERRRRRTRRPRWRRWGAGRPAGQGARRHQARAVGVDGLPAPARSRAWSRSPRRSTRTSRSTRRATPSTRRSTTCRRIRRPTAEVDRVKTQLLRGLENSLSNAQAIATGALNTAIAQGDWRLMFLQHDRLDGGHAGGHGPRGARRTSSRRTGRSATTSRIQRPDRTVVTAAPDLNETLRNYTSTVTVARGETFDPTIPNIESRIVRSKLPNGMKVDVLLEEDRQQHRHRDDRPALRRSDVARGAARSRRRSPAAC